MRDTSSFSDLLGFVFFKTISFFKVVDKTYKKHFEYLKD